MAYRFKLTEPMERGFRRIAGEQLDRAVARLVVDDGDAAVSVHEARKDLKRVRALLRFVRPALGDDVFKDLNRSLRDIGRSLSGRRDIDVLASLVARLAGSGDLKAAVVSRLQRALTSSRATAPADFHKPADNPSLVGRLEACRSAIEVAAWGYEGDSLDTSGLAECLDDCRKSFDAAFDSDDEEAIHEWRKSVQIHWRHMQLISAVWPEYCAARIAEARAISMLIGEERDLGMLLRFASSTAVKLSPAMHGSLETLLEARRPPLRTQARLRAQRLLADGTAGLCRRLEAYGESAAALKRLE
jgi:CHAD domain-containing protein